MTRKDFAQNSLILKKTSLLKYARIWDFSELYFLV